MTEDLIALVAALKLDRFTLLGLSLGGMVAIDYAGRQPAALERLVIVDIGPELITAGADRIRDRQQESGVFESREAAYEYMRAVSPIPPADHLRQRVYNNLMLTQDGAFTWRYDRALRSVRELKPRSAEEGWASCAAIAVPTLVMRGEVSDILAPEVARRMIETIADARLVTVEGSGHAIPLDKPDGFLAAARPFL
jgi:pimeloyl-ACP methyl ester carboxylesterase